MAVQARAARTAKKGLAGARAAQPLVPLHFTDLVVKVRRIQQDWPFPLTVLDGVGILRNQVVNPKAPAQHPADHKPATF